MKRGVFWALLIMGIALTGAAQDYPLRASISTKMGGDQVEYPPGNIRLFPQGPSVEDVAMAILLQDNGVRARVIGDKAFADDFGHLTINDNIENNEAPVDLVILSGSSGSGDVPNTQPMFDLGIPMMCGEHVCLAQEDKPAKMKMYIGGGTAHTDWRNTRLRKIRIMDKNHPITKGIETDADGWVQIFRDAYPNEGYFREPDEAGTIVEWLEPNKLVAATGLYDLRVALGSVNLKADGTQILGEVSEDELIAAGKDPDLRSVFAVVDKGGVLADGTKSPCRLVHWIINGEGSGGPGRNFLALNAVGRQLFIRACFWAMGKEIPSNIADFSLYAN